MCNTKYRRSLVTKLLRKIEVYNAPKKSHKTGENKKKKTNFTSFRMEGDKRLHAMSFTIRLGKQTALRDYF